MENETVSIDWGSVLTQWVFFFGLLTLFFYPAFKFKKLAKDYNKKSWLYFFIGLAVGIVGLNLGQLVVFPLKNYVVPEKYAMYLIPVLFLSAYLFYWLCYKFLSNYFLKPKND